ncbi:MAG: hypothetical protein ACRET3_05055 [Burkholderiales bacterium]
MKMAARLYASGAVPTKRAACRAVGLNEQYLSTLSRPSVSNPEVTSILGEVDQAIHNKSVALSAVIALIARRAARKMNELIDSSNDHVALKASADILDRNPETSKMQRHTVTAFNLDSTDAKELAAALVAGAKVREKYSAITEGDFVKVNLEDPSASQEQLRPASKEPVGLSEGLSGDQARVGREDDRKAAVEGETGTVAQSGSEGGRLKATAA